ncbi:TetR family transcriptional regulator C-terminal domain-containing protein [Deinococcus altitudinis]|uniref:TetR/AcrR family transcriptional regulator n=1 Tax=Deinococcus altitudinis TaxID=468914 RepID=UPI0038916EF8
MTKGNVRERLLEAGLDTLHRQSFNGTAVQDITQAAGVPKGSFYNHFESKEALGVAVVQRYMQRRGRHRAVLADQSLTPLDRILRYFSDLAEWAAENGYERGCLIGNFATELSGQSPAIRQELTSSIQEWVQVLAAVISEAQQTGQVSHELPPLETANLLIDAWQGAVMHSKVEQNGAPVRRFLSGTLKRLLL